jgi:hypothetical protein
MNIKGGETEVSNLIDLSKARRQRTDAPTPPLSDATASVAIKLIGWPVSDLVLFTECLRSGGCGGLADDVLQNATLDDDPS